MLRALDVERVPAAVQPAVAHPAAARTVVLVDEIDKAPRDFPNDLLNEIEQMSFRIPELGNVEIGGPRRAHRRRPEADRRRHQQLGEEPARPLPAAVHLLSHPVSLA